MLEMDKKDKLQLNLEEILKKLEKDGVKVKLEETGTGDNYIEIKTQNYEVRFGANDLGFWLGYIKET